jgi:hypothetical protein
MFFDTFECQLSIITHNKSLLFLKIAKLCPMKIHAEFITTGNALHYRRKTLLQFGDNADLIGSAVLINPGSAEPIGSADLNFIQAFYQNNHNLELENLALWKSFNPDHTMGNLLNFLMVGIRERNEYFQE